MPADHQSHHGVDCKPDDAFALYVSPSGKTCNFHAIFSLFKYQGSTTFSMDARGICPTVHAFSNSFVHSGAVTQSHLLNSEKAVAVSVPVQWRIVRIPGTLFDRHL